MTNVGSKKFSGKILGAANNSSKSTGSNEKLFKSMKQFVVFQLLFVLGASVVLVASSSAWAQQTFLPATQISGNLDGTITRNDFRISSDGERVVFLSNQNLVTELFSVPTGGGVVTRLSADLTFPRNVEVFSQISRSASPFQISPDNARVVYVSDQIRMMYLSSIVFPLQEVTSLDSTLTCPEVEMSMLKEMVFQPAQYQTFELVLMVSA